MNQFSELEQKLRNDPNADKIMKAANSEEGRRISQSLDQSALEKAAKSGDAAALKNILSQVLSTPDGKALAQKLQEVMKGK